MKKVIYILSIILISICNSNVAYTQTNYPPKRGSYLKDTTLNKYTGVWQMINNSDTLTVYLKKIKFHFTQPIDFYQDVIVGWHIYIKNGILVENTEKYENTKDSIKYRSYFGGKSFKFNQIKLYYHDLIKQKRGELFFSITNQNPLTAKWELKDTEGSFLIKKTVGFTLPDTLSIIKIANSPSTILGNIIIP